MSKPITNAERELYFWQYYPENLGGFKEALWKAISRADDNNKASLAIGFPEEVEAYQRFAHEEGYWTEVKKKMEDY